MDFIMKDVLSGELVPVLLGISTEAGETAKRLFREYGVISHIFCEKIPFSMRFSLCMKFHTIHRTSNERLMIKALKDFSKQLENTDVILYLIPCTEHYANLVWHHRDVLERRYVIADKPEMFRVWFGEENISIPVKKEAPRER